MMDFLRRLAPAREADATRAIAVLPSRFASESPLRATTVDARSAQFSEEDVSLSFDATSALAANAVAPQRELVGSAPAFDAPPRLDGSEPIHASANAADIDRADHRDIQHTHDASSARARPISPASSTNAATQALAPRNARRVVPLPDQPRAALPLSESILAQRSAQSRDDGQVVHVTIGRIDVVANTPAAPAARRTPAPRHGTVTLADYLRGGNGSRR